MDIFRILIGDVLPYLAAVGLIGGALYRLMTWKRTPQPGKMTLYPSKGWSFSSAVKEMLFFPNLYKQDRLFWGFAWTFHIALALAFLGHFRVVAGWIDAGLVKLGINTSGIETLSAVGGGIAGVALIVSIAALLFRRVFLPRVREISGVPDFFSLFLLIAVITTGNFMRFHVGDIDLAETRAWAFSLMSFAPKAPLHPAILVHAFFAEMLLLYVAFSKLMHFGGFFFTFSLVRK